MNRLREPWREMHGLRVNLTVDWHQATGTATAKHAKHANANCSDTASNLTPAVRAPFAFFACFAVPLASKRTPTCDSTRSKPSIETSRYVPSIQKSPRATLLCQPSHGATPSRQPNPDPLPIQPFAVRPRATLTAGDCVIPRHPQAACFASIRCATSVSAICTAFSAAPLRRLSDTHQNEIPCATVGSLRIRLTNTPSSPAHSSGVT
jgi:hypothetical protein